MPRIADIPLHDRPRERLLAEGREALSDRELLALVLGTGGGTGIGAHELAERLLARFGSLGRLARAHPAELTSVTGIGAAKAASLIAAFEMGTRRDTLPPVRRITSTSDIAALVAPKLRHLTRERAIVVVCDRVGKVLAVETVSEGGANRTLLPVREILVTVLRHDGQSFAVAHNHPSGDPTPSLRDEVSTTRLAKAAREIQLRLINHVVLSDRKWKRVRFCQ